MIEWREIGRFSVHGSPVPQGSPRAVIVKGKGGAPDRATVVSGARGGGGWGKRLQIWRGQVSQASRRLRLDEPLAGPLGMWVQFNLERPASVKRHHRQFPEVKPDLDKLLRSTWDGLSKMAYQDDAQLVRVTGEKVYAGDPWALMEGPGAVVVLYRPLIQPEPLAIEPGQ